MPDTASAVETLVAAGPLGAIIVVLSVAYWRQGLALKTTQEARVEDAKLVTKTLLELNDKWNTTVNTLTTAVDRLNDRLS